MSAYPKRARNGDESDPFYPLSPGSDDIFSRISRAEKDGKGVYKAFSYRFLVLNHPREKRGFLSRSPFPLFVSPILSHPTFPNPGPSNWEPLNPIIRYLILEFHIHSLCPPPPRCYFLSCCLMIVPRKTCAFSASSPISYFLE